jgi:hypothetical protein
MAAVETHQVDGVGVQVVVWRENAIWPFAPGTFASASGVVFPTEGCWKVTGAVGRGTLSFVTFVTKNRAGRT